MFEKAIAVFENYLQGLHGKDARLSPKFYQKEQKKWIAIARKEIWSQRPADRTAAIQPEACTFPPQRI
jgi:hypothetical protein